MQVKIKHALHAGYLNPRQGYELNSDRSCSIVHIIYLEQPSSFVCTRDRAKCAVLWLSMKFKSWSG